MVLPHKIESIYGIHVYTFKTIKGGTITPYQLTVDPTFKESKYIVELVNLMSKTNGFNDNIRQTVSHILAGFLVNIHPEIFFYIQVVDRKDVCRFYKFLRWVLVNPNVDCEISHLTNSGTQHVEFRVSLKED